MTITTRMTRRQFFEKLGKGSLVVGFSLSPAAASLLAREAHAASDDSGLTVLSGIQSGPLKENDAWLTVDNQGNITLFSGKVEIGTGTQTAFSQIVAEELDVDASAITYVQGDTSQTPDQGTTAGSKSIQVQGPLVRAAAATAYQVLSGLEAAGGPEANQPRKYAHLFNGQQILVPVNPSAPLKDPNTYTVVGQPVARLDLPDKCVSMAGSLGRASRRTRPHRRSTTRRLRRFQDSYEQSRSRISWVSSQPTSGRRSRRLRLSRSPGATAQRWCPTRSRPTCRQP